MIGSTVQFYKHEYSSEKECNVQIVIEGIILEKYVAPYIIKNEAIRGMSSDFMKVNIPIDFYLILTYDNELHKIPCKDIEKVINYKINYDNSRRIKQS